MTLKDVEGNIWSTNSESTKSLWILIIYFLIVGFLVYIYPVSALEIVIPDSPAIINDGQNSVGVNINQDLTNDAQSNYNNGIQIVKDSVNQDIDATPTQTNSGTSSSGGGGGGGGGGATSTEDYGNVIQYEEHDNALIKDKPVSFKFNLPIYEILLTGKENEYDVFVRVELLKNNSKVTTKLDDEVIQYFNVITSTKRMKEAVIRFKSNQSTELLRWNGSEWEKLTYQEVADTGLKIPQECIDEKQICYTYSLSKLSNFVIIKKPEIVVFTPEPTQTIPTPIKSSDLSSNPQPLKQSSGFEILLTISILLYLSRRR